MKSPKISHEKWNVWMALYFMIILLSKRSTTLGLSLCTGAGNSIVINTQKYPRTVTITDLNITPSGITPSSNILSAIRDFLAPQKLQTEIQDAVDIWIISKFLSILTLTFNWCSWS